MKKAFLIIIFLLLGLGCSFNTASNEAVNLCIQECQNALGKGEDLSAGPCLSNEITTNWVCDVAHNPRQDIDNNPDNQCSNYNKGADHFVEVTPECELIKAV